MFFLSILLALPLYAQSTDQIACQEAGDGGSYQISINENEGKMVAVITGEDGSVLRSVPVTQSGSRLDILFSGQNFELRIKDRRNGLLNAVIPISNDREEKLVTSVIEDQLICEVRL